MSLIGKRSLATLTGDSAPLRVLLQVRAYSEITS